MKKKFNLNDPKKAPARVVDSIKHEVNKYLARERRKPLQEGSQFWDFNCKIGELESSAKVIHVSEINKAIDLLVTQQISEFYLEILAKPGFRLNKPKN